MQNNCSKLFSFLQGISENPTATSASWSVKFGPSWLDTSFICVDCSLNSEKLKGICVWCRVLPIIQLYFKVLCVKD